MLYQWLEPGAAWVSCETLWVRNTTTFSPTPGSPPLLLYPGRLVSLGISLVQFFFFQCMCSQTEMCAVCVSGHNYILYWLSLFAPFPLLLQGNWQYMHWIILFLFPMNPTQQCCVNQQTVAPGTSTTFSLSSVSYSPSIHKNIASADQTWTPLMRLPRYWSLNKYMLMPSWV